MKLILMERGLWGFIEGNEEAPEVTEEDKKVKELKEFKSRSEKAYSLIALSVCKTLQVHLMNTTNPKVAWETLQKQFEFVSITHVVRLNREFYAATMQEGADLIEHITHFKLSSAVKFKPNLRSQ